MTKFLKCSTCSQQITSPWKREEWSLHPSPQWPLEEKPGAPTEPGTFLPERARRGQRGEENREPPPGEAGAELEMTTEALAGEPETWILGSTSAPSYLQPRLGLAFSGLQDSFPVVFPQGPKDHILVVGGRGSGRTRGFANQASKTERPGFKSYLCHPAAV